MTDHQRAACAQAYLDAAKALTEYVSRRTVDLAQFRRLAAARDAAEDRYFATLRAPSG